MPEAASTPAPQRLRTGAGKIQGSAFDPAEWAAIVDGDQHAFGRLVRRSHGHLYRMLHGLLRGHDPAEEVAQLTWIKVWRARKSFRGKASLQTWIFRIGTRTAFDWMRQRGRHRQHVAEDDPETALNHSVDKHPDGARRAELSESQRAIEAAIRSLSPNLRAVVTLREIEGLSYEAIASVLGCRVGTVMSRLHAARQQLKQALQSYR
ncbi:MAG: sigma-70 family RNA polymerase sigma factor [Opitutales bacterium]